MIIRLLRGALGLDVAAEVTVDTTTGNLLIANGSAELVSASEVTKVVTELIRPANTTAYTAGDVIANSAANVKQKETLTLTGAFGTATITCAGVSAVATFASNTTITAAAFVSANSAIFSAAGITLTSSGADLIFEASAAGVPFTAPAISNVVSDIAGTIAHTTSNVAAVKQKETLTLAGTYGACNISGAGGLTKVVTFTTSTTISASNFVTDFAADYLAAGITLTSSGADLIFESVTAGVAIVPPVIDGVAGDLAGTVAHTTANRAAVAQVDTVTFSGTSGIAHVTEVGGLTKDIAFVSTLKAAVDQFVLDHATAYDAVDITVTAGAVNTLIFTAKTAGNPLALPVVVGETGDLAGTAAVTTANVTAVAKVETITLSGSTGYATIAAAGGLTKIMTYTTSSEVSIDAFVTTNAALYLAQGIIISRSGQTLVFTASVSGTTFTAPTITNKVGITGTVVATTANVVAVAQVETITGTGTTGQATVAAAGGLTKIVTFDTTWQKTWDSFITTNQALYEAQNIHLYSQGNILTMTAVTAGTAFTAPTITNKVNLTGTVAHTTANSTIAPVAFNNLLTLNGSSTIEMIKVETDMTALAGQSLKLWFYNDIPTVVADNAPWVETYSDKNKFLFSKVVTLGSLLSGSNMVSGSVGSVATFSTTGKTLYCVVQTMGGFTPTSGGAINLTVHSSSIPQSAIGGSTLTQIVGADGANIFASGKPVVITGTVQLPFDASSYAANDAINNSATVPTEISFDVDAALANGGGGIIGLVKIEAASQFAGKTINLALYKDVPTSIPADNTPFLLTSSNTAKRIAIVPVMMDAVLGASTICFGQASVMIPYQTLASAKTLKGLLFVSDAVTSPTVSSVITVAITTIQIA